MKLAGILLLIIFSILAGCSGDPTPVEVIQIEGLQKLIKEDNHKIHVINFWATWCKPCIKEMPQFIALSEAHPEIDVSLVSLDFVEEMYSKVVPFQENNEIKLRVLLMDELDYNLWIDMVDSSWSGAIPATLIIEPATGRRKFLEKELENNELEDEIKSFTKMINDD